ncbi:MAG: hypothetical protein RL301_500, partial [Actinomycetota bacterium]
MKSTSSNLAKSTAAENIHKPWLGATRAFTNQV